MNGTTFDCGFEDGSWPLPNNEKKEGDSLEIGQLQMPGFPSS